MFEVKHIPTRVGPFSDTFQSKRPSALFMKRYDFTNDTVV